ncbi:MAG: hypothetical protein ACO3TX_06775 [Pseudomonadales bacterium]
MQPLTHRQMLDHANELVKTINRRVTQINRTWGWDVLPRLVSVETMTRFRKQRDRWEMTCFELIGTHRPEELDRLDRQASAMLRAFDYLEQQAKELGHHPTPPEYWEFVLPDGTPCALVRDRAQIGQVSDRIPAGNVWALEEIADIITRFPELISTKQLFPCAETLPMGVSQKIIDDLDDSLSDLPW